ncbi:PQQ-binding-like beta-propeller repeat protein [Kitasatospora sp. NPDC052896]|uniref:PQQ-binding-like beta-propeller repeat protein n=1 Tax=Kitasatospora sp. NPDC052896 TaxID=3364061 RepID=UPI0037CAEEC3
MQQRLAVRAFTWVAGARQCDPATRRTASNWPTTWPHWRRALGSAVSDPAIADGVVYVTTEKGAVLAFDALTVASLPPEPSQPTLTASQTAFEI